MTTIQENSLILVVDDSYTNLLIISDLLKYSGFDVSIASDGESALQQVECKPPDLILLDLVMPGIDGFEICKRLKSNPTTSDIPVIFMTGMADTDSKVKGFELGAVDYIIKPFQATEVLARLKTHLQLRNLTKTLEFRVAAKTSELTKALAELQASQAQLVQKEKMSALGNLVAGVAHEINNPLGFIAGNLQPAIEHIQDLLHIIDLYQSYYPQPIPELQAEISDIDLDFIRDDLPSLIASMQEGVLRIRDITTSLRTFSRGDKDRQVLCNIHDCINSTLIILKHRLKSTANRPDIQVIKNYAKLPLIQCFSGPLNQVFMNILANSIDAIDESNYGRTLENILANPNKIDIQTNLSEDGNSVIIEIKDNGVGMSPTTQEKIFEHLFTTKAVGQGTGLGLSIVKEIIIVKHGGNIEVNSVVGKGSEFVITLPINNKNG
ncbi:hybrid sensor histidine kinase/response regulator [Anabaena sp. UHCC 0187]|uniref:hybrid sensor histidine kinase/response regulator n=1 Tax=Anabaena sp. UHCC 0187 TaxID=2590018 RepID=UPI0014489C32|nr:response regulator [Anabaena sp. UHCC 0187]MTJ15236.1 hybrid sensor histidine kinase/response regulator [Anabaena sp. UHCC 0187]